MFNFKPYQSWLTEKEVEKLPVAVALALAVLAVLVCGPTVCQGAASDFNAMPSCQTPITLSDGNVVACGYCIPCMARNRRDWAFRLDIEHQHSTTAYFLTLTYDEANVPWSDEHNHYVLHKPDLQKFMHDLRKANRQLKRVGKKRVNLGEQFRWFSCGEYGENTMRPHYHAILFNLRPDLVPRLHDIWGKGFIKVGTVTAESCNYVAKYHVKLNHDAIVMGKLPKPFKLVTKSSGGIGKQWINEPNIIWAKNRLDGLIHNRRTGKLQPMPKYYKDRVYDFAERTLVRANIMATLDKKFCQEIEAIKARGYTDPYLEYANRETAYINNVKHRILKASVL